jgi:hypothetical protein
MMLDVPGDGVEEGTEGSHQERRKVQLLAALELAGCTRCCPGKPPGPW